MIASDPVAPSRFASVQSALTLVRADFFVPAVAPFREHDRPFVRPRTGKDRHLETAVIRSPLHMPAAGRLAILEQECWVIAGYAHIWLTPLLPSECLMRDNEIDQVGRHDQMYVGAVVTYRQVDGHVGRRLIRSRLRVAAEFSIGVDPGFERPIGDPAREWTFRLRGRYPAERQLPYATNAGRDDQAASLAR
jgi:hypothetical protein